jgi:hypothetical protein
MKWIYDLTQYPQPWTHTDTTKRHDLPVEDT